MFYYTSKQTGQWIGRYHTAEAAKRACTKNLGGGFNDDTLIVGFREHRGEMEIISVKKNCDGGKWSKYH